MGRVTVIVTNYGFNKPSLLSEADFRSMEETLYLSSIPTMREKIMDGINTSLDECVEDEDE